MAFSLSESSIRFAAREGMISQIQVSRPDDFKRLCSVYQEVAAENGRDLGLGENVAAPRTLPAKRPMKRGRANDLGRQI